LQTNNTTPKAGNSSWWDAKSDEEKRAHIAKMTAGRQRARKAANGNGIRPDIAAAVALADKTVAEFQALNDAKRALSGNATTRMNLVDAVIIVQDALERGELELVAHDGKPAFYKVTRERVA
jgi:hypothetical protein